MRRHTKIVCTLGPATNDRETVRALIRAGMDVARLNFSHGTHEDHARMMGIVRDEAKRVGRVVPILQDLQGPKIRVGKMAGGGVLLHEGRPLTLTAEPMDEGTDERVYVSYDGLARDVEPGGRILLDDGNLELRVTDIRGVDVITEVVVGGPLRSRKGVNLPHIRSSTPSLTEKDLADLEFGLDSDVDFVALSFVRTGHDVDDLHQPHRRVRQAAAGHRQDREARGHHRHRPHHRPHRRRHDRARRPRHRDADAGGADHRRSRSSAAAWTRARPCITATQMLESMIDNPRPTRAEASDVANAVLDGSDAVMLSGETAAGKYPVRAVAAMADIIEHAESQRVRFGGQSAEERVHDRSKQLTQAISHTAVRLADEIGAVAICVLTHSGGTARALARHRPNVPIYAFTDAEKVVGQMAILWGTEGIAIPFQRHTDDGIRTVHRTLLEKGLARPGDQVVITAGLPLPAKGLTNMVHVSRL